MTKRIFIIDGHGHIYAAYFAPMAPLSSPSGEPTKAVYVFTTAVLGLIKNEKPDMLVVVMDSKVPSFRVKMYEAYKAHRPPMPDDMPRQIERIEQIMGALGIPVVRVEGFEADDVIGTLAKRAAAKGYEAYICSKDKDMLQLLDEGICTYDMKTGQRFDRKSLMNETGLLPEQFVDVFALQGDASDNVPGVADVGPKTAMEWIRKYGSLDNVYAHADEIGGKRGDNLRSSKEIAYLSRRLVTIDCDVPIDVDEKGLALSEPDKVKLAELYDELGFTRLKSQLDLPAVTAVAKPMEEDKQAAATVGQLENAKTMRHDYHLVDTEEKFEAFFEELKKQKVFAVDTETTGLDAMRAELVGMSFCWEAHKAYYLPVRGPMGARCLELSKIREKLGKILADGDIKKIGQNIKYDMLILHNAGMPLRGVYFDTMVASYCLWSDRMSHSMDAMARDYLNYECVPISSLIGKGKNQLTFDMVDIKSAAEYAAEDADITLRLYQYLAGELAKQPKIEELFEKVEMPLVSVLAQMELNGVFIDTRQLRSMSIELADTLEKLNEKIYRLAGTVFNIASTKQLAEVLFDRLGLKSTKTGKTLRSTDADVLEQLRGEHEIIPLIVEHRTLSKLQNTYVDKLGSLINPKTGRVHASFNQTVTATGRLSSSDPNLQNIPIRTELGKKIRAAFVGQDKKDCILSADYSQIELRMLAHFSKDKALLKAFAEDQDIHKFVASQVYGIALSEVTSQMRAAAKTVNFGIIYGQGAFALAQSLGISRTEAKKFIDDYFARYSAIRDFINSCIRKTRATGYAETILGRRRAIGDVNSRNHNRRAQAERLAVNTVIQGSAADLIKVAMINIQRKIDEKKLNIRMILQIHDELVFELPPADAEKHGKWIADEMAGAIKLDVPLKVDVAIGSSWLAEG